MPRQVNDLTGRRFGRLLVVYQATKAEAGFPKSRNAHWICRCDCGNRSIVCSTNLLGKARNVARSCGCLRDEVSSLMMRSAVVWKREAIKHLLAAGCDDPAACAGACLAKQASPC